MTTPHFTPLEIGRILTQHYNLSGQLKPLPSDRDQNFLLTPDNDQPKLVIKVANANETIGVLQAQNDVMQRLAPVVSSCPAVLPSVDGDLIVSLTGSAGQTHFLRAVTFLEGMPMGDLKRHTPALRESLGQELARFDAALADYDHPAFHYDFNWDMKRAHLIVDQHSHLIADAEMRGLVGKISAEYATRSLPNLATLRHSIIHNDANDYNVLVGGGSDLYSKNQTVTGLIDFGDMIHSVTIADLAIAIAYAILDQPEPLQAAADLVRGYHKINPLTPAEIDVLFDLVLMRLCVSASMSAYQRTLRPDDDYLLISQQPIRNTLPQIAAIPHPFATATLRSACGWEPSEPATALRNWLKSHPAAPILGQLISDLNPHTFDLSVSSPLLESDPTANTEPVISNKLQAQLAKQQSQVGIGRYCEPRLIYAGPQFGDGDPLGERRTIHLGLDLFCPAGTPIFAPFAGSVAIIAHNPDPFDYGGLLILHHQPEDGPAFFTLFGHLDFASLAKHTQGDPIAAGQPIANLGTPAQNGGWPPHLHLQIISAALGVDGDCPGVCRASELAIWQSFCPDPNLIVGVSPDKIPPLPPSKNETLKVRREKIGRNLSIGYKNHVKVVRAHMQYLFDETGRRYLDAYNNVPHVGHSHPRVIETIREQIGILNTNTRYLHDNLNTFAEKLTATLPDPLSVCFFVNSGSEANELAIRLTRAYTGHRDMIVNEGAYHGHSTTLIDISPYKHDGPGGTGAPDWVHTTPVADVYRGKHKTGLGFANEMGELIERLQSQNRGLAAFMFESCPSVGGQIILPEGYLKAAFEHVRAAGGLCIADDVQTGYGRVGTHFYGFMLQDVVPDIVVLGKPIGNGHPIGAVITTPEIASAFNNGMEFFSTFGGNTVSCAVGSTVLDIVHEEKLMPHANQVGTYLLDGLRSLKDQFPLIGDVRGSGLFLGVELVRNHETLEPAAAEASTISNRLREHGILLGTDGPLHNVIKIRPPMPFSIADADILLNRFARILSETEFF